MREADGSYEVVPLRSSRPIPNNDGNVNEVSEHVLNGLNHLRADVIFRVFI